MKNLVNILLLFFYCLITQAQHPFAWQLTTEDGLPSMEVYDLYQDKKGYMWIGTDKGLCKYNGRNFYYYHNEQEKGLALSGIQEDSEGRIWVRNFKNQLFYVQGDSLTYFKEIERINPVEISDFLLDSDDNIWITSSAKDSVYRYHTISDQWKEWLVNKDDPQLPDRKGIFCIKEGANKEVYIASPDGLFKWSKDKVYFLTRENLIVSKNTGLSIIAMALLFTNERLFILQNQGKTDYVINEFVDNRIERNIELSSKKKWIDKSPHNLRSLSNGVVWQISLEGGGAPLFNLNNNSVVDTNLTLFPNQGISDILIDHEGNYWVSSLKTGVYIIPQLALQQYTSSNSIFSEKEMGVVAKSLKGNLLVSTDKGKILSYNTNTQEVEHYYKTEENPCNFIHEEKGKLLASGKTFQHIYHLKDSLPFSQNTLYSTSFGNMNLYKDSILVLNLTYEGLVMTTLTEQICTKALRSNEFEYLDVLKYYDKVAKLDMVGRVISSRRCNWVFADSDKSCLLIAWLDTLMCYPEQKAAFPILDKKLQPIEATYITKGDGGFVWVASIHKGIYGIDKNLDVVCHFTTKDGLLDNRIKKIVPDEQNLWLLTHKGVQVFNLQTKESHIYTLQDGLPTHEIKDLTIVKNQVWLSTTEGLVSFDKKMSSKNLIAPPIYIQSITINDKAKELAPTYKLDYTQNTIFIYVEGISFKSQGKFTYKYRMLGLDTIWRSQSSDVNFMRYFQLQAGTYLFEVKAVNEEGIESINAARVQFVITPPYWQTWWFQGGLYLVGILIIIGIILFRIRIKQVEERQQNKVNVLKMQALQSQMNPHFIFNVLTAVQNMWLQKKNEGAMEMQSIFAKLLRKIFQYSGQTVISIEQEEDFLNNYLSLEQVRFENKVEINFSIEDELLEEDYYIPPLLIQPILENSFKHGLFHKVGDKKLTILLKIEEPYLYCCVEDNGVGRGQEQTEDRVSGLSTTKERLLILQETALKKPHPEQNFKITDLFSENKEPIGTKVELWIPFLKP